MRVSKFNKKNQTAKKILLLFLGASLLATCSPDDFKDCLLSSGSLVVEEIQLDSFEEIIVGRNIALTIIPAENNALKIEGRRNHVTDFDWRIEYNSLRIEANSLCSAGFSEAPLVVELYAENLTRIVSGTQFLIKSEVPLTFPELTIVNERFVDSRAGNTGLYDLLFDNDEVYYVANNVLTSTFRGTTNKLRLLKTGNFGAIDASSLEAKSVEVFHRGFNDILVHPTEILYAEIRSTGNLILVNEPDQIEVETFFTGQLIYPNE